MKAIAQTTFGSADLLQLREVPKPRSRTIRRSDRQVLPRHRDGLCSTQSVELVRSIGADHVINYTRDDVTRRGMTYDLMFQLGGTTSPGAFRPILTPSGRLVLSSGDSTRRVIGPMGRIVRAVILSAFIGQTMRPLTTRRSRQDLEQLRDLIEGGNLTPVIEATYPLSAAPEVRARPRCGTRTGQARHFRPATR
jgi:NADPH:quinone reductase-like Zn-dependent oxidoreductase